MTPRKILIIAYTFPPTPGIGGRRWAKFAKYLLRRGHDVRVLTIDNPANTVSEWYSDVRELEEAGCISFFKSGYPDILGTQPKTIRQKLTYRLALLYVKLKLRGNYYDRSAHCKTSLMNTAERFVQQGYNNVIVTVGPFTYSYFLTDLKKKYPQINFIVDVRDPWTNNRTSFGYEGLSGKRMELEQMMEKAMSESADYITGVADDMVNFFTTEYGVTSKKTLTIRNGFDPEDIKTITDTVADGRLKLIFAGTVYEKAVKYVDILVAALQRLKTEDIKAYQLINCEFYGSVPGAFHAIAAKEPAIVFKGQLPLNEVYGKIAEADAAMLFLTDDMAYSFSTKFYEYLAMRRPILVFSSGGSTGNYVEAHGIGLSLTPQTIDEKLQLAVSLFNSGRLHIPDEYDTTVFRVDCLVQKFEEILI